MTYEYNLKEKKLNLHETYPSYTEAEKKYSNSENQVNNLRNFIITKTKDMNYEEVKDECKKLVDDINKTILKTKWVASSSNAFLNHTPSIYVLQIQIKSDRKYINLPS